MRLYNISNKDKILYTDIYTEGAKLITKWGQLGGAEQETSKVCTPKNIGKSNELSAPQQANVEAQAKIEEKIAEGYVEVKGKNITLEKISKALTAIKKKALDLDNLPEYFCPSKPINQTPEKILKSFATFAQRKHNGHCLILTRGKKETKVYTRRIENISEVALKIPEIKIQADKLPPETMVLAEFFFTRKESKREVPTDVQGIVGTKNSEEAYKEYERLLTLGSFGCKVFDILFHKHKFIGDKSYGDRYAIMLKMELDVPEILSNPWQDRIAKAKEAGWEGFVLRNNSNPAIGYTLDGKAKRMGAYKFKFTKTDDFVVTEALMGKSGKHANYYCKFKLIQYNKEGGIIDRKYVGGGCLSHDELAQLTKDINSQKISIPFVVEAEYSEFNADSGAIIHGQIQRLRPDKAPKECIYESD